MKKEKLKNGFTRLVFGRGDGVLKRWTDSMQKWRAEAPAKRHLSHPVGWYLDADARSKRPVYGLLSTAIFTERVLWEALTTCDPNGREVASARRAFLFVRRKMEQMRYRGRNGRIQNRTEQRYLRSSVSQGIELAKKAWALVETEKTMRREEEEKRARLRQERQPAPNGVTLFADATD